MEDEAFNRGQLLRELALKMDLVSHEAMQQALADWTGDQNLTLGAILVRNGVLSRKDQELLEELIDRGLAQIPLEPTLIQGAEQKTTGLQAGDSHTGIQKNLSNQELKTLPLEESAPSQEEQQLGVHGLWNADRYIVLRPHDKGGLGEVFLALDKELRRLVALKEIKRWHANDERKQTRFVFEANVTSQLEHPGIVPIYGFGRYADGRPFYAMRFIRGQSMSEAIQQFHESRKLKPQAGKKQAEQRLSKSNDSSASESTPLTEKAPLVSGDHGLAFRTLLTRFVTVCNTIHYANSNGYLHRDLKPGNIMLGRFGETLVVDWGLAKQVARPSLEPASDGEVPSHLALADSAETMAGSAIGTPGYMSPEQATGQLEKLSAASDIYSLGATLYTILTGVPPYRSADPKEIMHKAQNADFPRVRAIEPQAPRALEAICEKAMALRAEDRYRDCSELAAEIERWLADEPVVAFEEPWSAKATRWVKRHKAFVGSTAVLLITAVISLAIGNVFLADANRETEKQREVADRERNAALHSSQIAEDLRKQAEAKTHEAERNLYAAKMGLVHAAWNQSEMDRAVGLLKDSVPASQNVEDRRGFEWYYWNRKCNADLWTTADHAGYVEQVSFSPDGNYLASAGWDGTVRIRRPQDGKVLQTLLGHTGVVRSVSFRKNGVELLTCGEDGTIRTWDRKTGKQLTLLRGHSAAVWEAFFSPDESRIISGGLDNTVRIWDCKSQKCIHSLDDSKQLIHTVAISPDGRWIASGSTNGEIRIRHAADGKVKHVIRAHNRYVSSVCFSPDSRRLASGSADWSVKIWDVELGTLVRTLDGHKHVVSQIAFHPEGRRLASVSFDQTIKIWGADSGNNLETYRGHAGHVATVCFSPDGGRLITGGWDGKVKAWDAVRDRDSLFMQEHDDAVQACVFCPDGSSFATCSLDGTVRLWDTATGQLIKLIGEHTSGVMGVCFSPDGSKLASASYDQTAVIWDIATSKPIHTLKEHKSGIVGVSFSPDGKRVATASLDHTAMVWDAATGKRLYTLAGHSAPVRGVTYSTDGSKLATSSWDKKLRIWNPETGETIKVLEGHSDTIEGVRFNSDGRLLASASADRTAIVWDLSKGTKKIFPGHAKGVNAVCFSPDSKRLFTAAKDTLIRVWDIQSGQQLLVLSGHEGWVDDIDLSKDGFQILSCDGLGVTRIWDARPIDERLRNQYEAHSLIRRQILKPITVEEARKVILADNHVTKEVREQALAALPKFSDVSVRFSLAAWGVAKDVHSSKERYQQALHCAQTAAKIDPKNPEVINVVGAALFRTGEIGKSLETLLSARPGIQKTVGADVPSNIAFLAMAYHRSGKKSEANSLLPLLRQLASEPRWRVRADIQTLLEETEKLLGSK